MKAPIKRANIPQALQKTAELWPDRGIHFYDRMGVKAFSSYPQLLTASMTVAETLRRHGLQPGDKILVALPSGFDFIHAFIGALIVQVQPIPLPLPRGGNLSHAVAKLGQAAEAFGARALLTAPESVSPLLAMADAQRRFDIVIGSDQMNNKTGETTIDVASFAAITHDDDAYIQCTSGTSGAPKGVPLTHGNILTNVTDIGNHLKVTDSDIGVSWLPMVHDMGLLGVLIFSMCWGLPLVLLDPELFLKAPHEWLWCIHNHSGTLSPASNFGYHYCARRARKSDLEGLDLSTWRVAMSGSETVNHEHLMAFERRFRPFGLRPKVFVPVYGLAEATVAVTFGDLEKDVRIDTISRNLLESEGIAKATDEMSGDTKTVIGVGKPLPNVSITLRDKGGAEVKDRVVGEIFVRGDSTMRNYVGTDEPQEEGWIATGDLGYTHKKELFILGRKKDVINLGDRSVYPHDIELLLSKIDGVRPGGAVAFGIHLSTAMRSRHENVRAAARTESGRASRSATAEHAAIALHGAECLIIAVEAAEGIDHQGLYEVTLKNLYTHLGVKPHDLRVLSPGSIPKTSSGKLQRQRCRRYYLDETLDLRERRERRQALTNITERARSYVAQVSRRIRTYFDET